MAKIPANIKKIKNKTIPFSKESNKFSNVSLLPEVLQTKSNKQILSTTLDNVTSRGNLEQINGFVGKKQGGYYSPSQDRYINDTEIRNKYQLSPSPVSYNEDQIYSSLTLDDLKNSLQDLDASTFNWNTQIDVPSYTFTPPVNIDKFVNYASYFWIDNPIYISAQNVNLSNVVGKISASIDSVQVKNGMCFKIASVTGSNTINLQGDQFVANTRYIIKGVGDYIELVPFTDNDKQSLFVSGADENVFPAQFVCIAIGAKNNNAWSRTNFWVHNNVIDIYEQKLLYDINQNYNVGDWVFSEGVFYKKINAAGTGTTLSDISQWVLKYNFKTDYKNIQAQRPIIEFDSRLEMYATGTNFLTVVDYWSVFKTPANIISDGTINKQFKDINGNWSSVINNVTLQDGDVIVLAGVSSSYNNKIYRFNTGSPNTLTEITVSEGDVILFGASTSTHEITNLNYVQEYYYNGLQWVNAQLKTRSNQNPKFTLYDNNGTSLDNFSNSNFTGTTIFQYSKAIAGINDSYLGYPLKYDSTTSEDFNVNSTGHIEFEYTQQNTVKYVNNNENIDVLGFYYTKLVQEGTKNTEYSNSWTETYVPQQTTKTITKIYDSSNFGNDFYIDIPTDKIGFGNVLQLEYDTDLYFYYKRDNQESLPIQGKNPVLYIPTNTDISINVNIDPTFFQYVNPDYVDADYVDAARFKILDILGNVIPELDGNNNPTGIVNNNINDGTISINLNTSQTLQYSLGNITGKIFVIDSSRMPGAIEVYKNNVLQIVGNLQEVNAGTKDYYYLDSKTIVFKYFNTDEKKFTLADNGIIEYIDTSTENLPLQGLKIDDVFNIKYVTYDQEDETLFDTPFILEHNWKNEEINKISYNKIFSHYINKLDSNPLKTGTSFGLNDSYNIVNTSNLGGTIFHFDGNAVDSLINFANNDLDIISSIRFAKKQYLYFKNSFVKTLIAQLNTTNSTDVYDIVNNVLTQTNLSSPYFGGLVREGDSVFFNSTMIHYNGLLTNIVTLTNNQQILPIEGQEITGYTGRDIQHIYVYLYEDIGNSNFKYKPLVKDIDYSICDFNGITNEQGNHIKLLSSYVVGTKIRIVSNPKDSYSFCAPTPTKLGITPAYVPGYENFNPHEAGIDYYYFEEIINLFGYNNAPSDRYNVSTSTAMLRGHDGSLTVVNNNLPSLFYDCILEFETRIYNNIKNKKDIWDKDIDPENYFFQNQHFTSKNLHKNFNNFLYEEGISTLKNNTFDISNPFTWNYSKLNVPGHYKGLYRYYLGSKTPHRTPWECLGYSIKPSWWDTTYDWRDTANGGDDNKRTKLINAIIYGIYNDRSSFAQKHYYVKKDLTNFVNSVVNAAGELVDPVNANLFTTSQINSLREVDIRKDWTFNDISDIEEAYRNTSDYVFDWVEAAFSTFPVKFWHKYWVSNNILEKNDVLNNQRIFKNTKLRTYQENQTLHSLTNYYAAVFGLNLYCLEYLKFKKIDTTVIQTILQNLNTVPLIKLAGFTKKSLINLKYDTLLNQTKTNFVPEEDYQIQLYKSSSLRKFFVSTVEITKVDKGYKIAGFNPLETFFRVQNAEPNTNTLSVEVVEDIFVQEYVLFSDTVNEILYNTVLNSVQEVYNFLTTYGKYLENQGVIYNDLEDISSWRTLGKQFVIWAIDTTRNKGDVFYVSQNPNKILLDIPNGFIDFKNQRLVDNILSLNKKKQSIPNSKLKIVREDNNTLIESLEEIGGIQIYVKNIEHIIVLNNETKFNDVLSSNLLGVSKPRLKIIGKKTEAWQGKPKALGYIIKNNTIVENLESSAENFSQYNNIESSIANKELQKTSRFNTGFTKPEFLQNLNIEDDQSYEFYLGSMHDKGTNEVFDKLLRNKDLFIKDSNFQINTKEEWLFRLGELGDVEGQQTIEFEMPKELVKTNPQTVTFQKQFDLARDSQSDDKITLFSTDSKWVYKPTYSPTTTHTLNLNYMEHTLQNNLVLPKLVINDSLSKTFYTLLKGHTYVLKPQDKLLDYITTNNVTLKITTITGSGATATLTEYTENVSYNNNNLEIEISYNAPQRLFITLSDKLSSPLFGFSLLVLPNNYEFNDIIFKTRPYLDFKYNNIFFTQYPEDLPNAGYPMVGDALYEIRNREQLLNLDLSDKSLFGIANWDSSIKYKKDDLVRYKGSLYKALQNVPAQATFTTTVAGGVQSGDAITINKYNNIIPLIGSNFVFSGDTQVYTFMELVSETTSTYTAVVFPTVTNKLVDLQNVTVTAPSPQRFDFLGPGTEEGIYYDDDYWLAQPEDSIFSVWLSDWDKNGFNVLQLMDYEDSTSYEVTTKITDIVAHEGVDTDPPQTRSYITEICPGNEAGDLAMVKFAVDHTLKVNDYILINGATHNKKINGIHRIYGFPEGVDSNGKSFADTMVYIEEFIEENEHDCKMFAFKPTRFKTLVDLQATSTDSSYYWRDGNLAYVDKGASGNWEVYKYNRLTGMQLWLLYDSDDYYDALNNGYGFNSFPDGTVNQILHRTHPQQVDNRAVDNVVLYNKIKNEILIDLEVYDPFKGLIPGIADKELDFKCWYDPASYNETTDPYITLNKKSNWNNEFIGKTWWDLNTVRYYNYEQGNSTYRRKYWGKQFSSSSIDVYEWTKSPYHPSEYEAHLGEIFETQKLSGTPYSVVSGIDTYYYYTTNVEFDKTTSTYKEFYYFWVKNKSSIPNLPTRNLSVSEIGSIINNPTSRGIRWCAPISDNEIILANVNDVVNENTVVQVNLNLTGNQQHAEWHLLRENDKDSVVPELFKLKMQQSIFGYRNIVDITEYYTLVDTANEAIDINYVYPDTGQNTYKLVTDTSYSGNTLNKITENFSFSFNQLVKYSNNYYTTLQNFSLSQNPMTPGQTDINQGLVLPTTPDIYYPWTSSPNYDYDNNSINDSFALQLPEHQIFLTNIWSPAYNVQELTDIIVNPDIFANYPGQLESAIATSTIVGLINKQEIPQKFANMLAKYGNKFVPNQSWIKNKKEARRVFVNKFNEIIKKLNIVDNLQYWNDVNNIFKNNSIAIGNFSYDATTFWNYTGWQSSDFSSKTITDVVSNKQELNNLTPSANKVVKLLDDGNQSDSAIYEAVLVANQYQWKKVYKEKGTIFLKSGLWDTREETGFDVEIWDSTTFDNGPDTVFEILYKSIQENIFVGSYETYFTDVWFELIKYILSEQFNVDWIIKTSYLQLKLVSDGSIKPAFYSNNNEQVLVDYINNYKPYHSKIRNVFNTKAYLDLVNVTIEESAPTITVS